MATGTVARWPARRPRVVVTGLGVVSCLGAGVKHCWRRLINGETGIVSLKGRGFESLPCRIGGLVPVGERAGELSERLLDRTIIRQKGLASLYGLLAAEEALRDSIWHPDSVESRNSTGMAIGRVTADLDAIGEAYLVFKRDGRERRISPYTSPIAACNISAFSIGEKYGFTGPQMAPATACAAGAHALIAGFQAIVLQDAEVMVCGGTDAATTAFNYAAYSKARALSTKYNDTPELASRPFDRARDGFVAGDGAAIIVLENLEHALKRGAKIYCEMLGYGMCQDRGTVTSPDEDGFGSAHSMLKAVNNSGLSVKDIGYVNAHATSTPTGDTAEAKGILTAFGPHASEVYVASNKGALGHMQGASGAVEAMSSILSCQEAVIPHTVNLSEPEVEGLNYVMGKAIKWDRERRIVVSNSFGFGSSCASLVFSNFENS